MGSAEGLLQGPRSRVELEKAVPLSAPRFSVSVVWGSPKRLLLSLSLPRSLANLSSTSPGSAWTTSTTHPWDGAAGGCAPPPLSRCPAPLGEPGPSLTLGTRFSSVPGSGHKGFVCQSCPLAGHPFDFGLSGGGETLWEGSESPHGVGNHPLEVEEELVSSAMGHQVPVGQVASWSAGEARKAFVTRWRKPAVFSASSLPSPPFGGGRWPGVPTVAPGSFPGVEPLLLVITPQMSTPLTAPPRAEQRTSGRPDASLKILKVHQGADAVPSNKNARMCFQVRFNLLLSLHAGAGHGGSPSAGVWEGRGLTGP